MRFLFSGLSVILMFLLPYEINGGHLKYSVLKTENDRSWKYSAEQLPNSQVGYLEFTTSDNRPSGNGEQVDASLIPVPLPDYSPLRYINSNNLPSFIFSKRETSMLAHFNLFSSFPQLQRPFISILRI